MIGLLARSARHGGASILILFLISRVLGPFHCLLILVLRLHRRVQTVVSRLLRLVEVNGRVVELQIGEFLWVSLPCRWRVHPTPLLVLVSGWPDVVGVVGCGIQVLVLAERHGLVVLSLTYSCGASPLGHLVLIMVMLWGRVNRLVPPIAGIEGTVGRLLGYRIIGLGSSI